MISSYSEELKYKNDELAIAYLPAVRAMAFRLKERLPSSVDYMDLSAIGTEELLKVARRYDEKLNDSFWGYAKKRVYGAMLDYLRSLDVVSRSSRKLIKSIDSAIEEYRVKFDTDPSDEELASILNEDLQKIKEAKIASSIYTLLPINEQLSYGDNGAAMEKIENDELIEKIREILERYPQKEQMVISMYYFEELSLKEIAEVLDLTESRVSQIHKSVITKIRQSLGA